jgi:hypothetical protein
MITADDWMDLSFKVVFSVGLMAFICDYKRVLTPRFLVSSQFFISILFTQFPTDDI